MPAPPETAEFYGGHAWILPVRQFEKHVAVAWAGNWTEAKQILPAEYVELLAQRNGIRVRPGDPLTVSPHNCSPVVVSVDWERVAPL